MTTNVYYPHGGKHFLIHYWSYDDRGHLILARSEASATSLYNLLFADRSDVEVREFLEIEIVSPTPSFQTAKDKAKLEWAIGDFKFEIAQRMRDLVKAKHELPPPFFACLKYEPEEDVDVDEWAKESHYNCKSCVSGIAAKLSPAELYEKYHADWREKNRRPSYPSKGLVPNKAPVANEGDKLWFAYANFGHHSGGIELHEVVLENASGVDRVFSDSVLFFYHILSEKDKTAMQAVIDHNEKQKKAKREEADRLWHIEREEGDRKRIEEAFAFFKERE